LCNPHSAGITETASRATFDVYSDSHNRALRIAIADTSTITLPQGTPQPQTLKSTTDFSDFGAPVQVQAPPADQVTDRTKQFIAILLGTASSKTSTIPPPSQAATSTTMVPLSKALSDYFKGDMLLARSEFQAIVKADPANHIAWYDLGTTAQEVGNNREADTDYVKAISVDQTYEPALYNEAVLRFQEGDMARAASYVTRALAIKPADGAALRLLAQILARTRHA